MSDLSRILSPALTGSLHPRAIEFVSTVENFDVDCADYTVRALADIDAGLRDDLAKIAAELAHELTIGAQATDLAYMGNKLSDGLALLVTFETAREDLDSHIEEIERAREELDSAFEAIENLASELDDAVRAYEDLGLEVPDEHRRAAAKVHDAVRALSGW
jgi:hypothetical protein